MIVGSLQHIDRYYGIHKRLDRALSFLEQESLEAYEAGHYPIEGEDVYLNRFDYSTEPGEGSFESHRDYLDIHIVIEGEEYLGYAEEAGLTVTKEYDPEGDYTLLSGTEQARVLLRNGTFAICFPEDAHMPKICTDTPTEVRKAVLKVRVTEKES